MPDGDVLPRPIRSRDGNASQHGALTAAGRAVRHRGNPSAKTGSRPPQRGSRAVSCLGEGSFRQAAAGALLRGATARLEGSTWREGTAARGAGAGISGAGISGAGISGSTETLQASGGSSAMGLDCSRGAGAGTPPGPTVQSTSIDRSSAIDATSGDASCALVSCSAAAFRCRVIRCSSARSSSKRRLIRSCRITARQAALSRRSTAGAGGAPSAVRAARRSDFCSAFCCASATTSSYDTGAAPAGAAESCAA